MVTSALTPSMFSDYGSIFNGHVSRAIEWVQIHLPTEGTSLTREEIRRTLHILDYALPLAELGVAAWPAVRALVLTLAPLIRAGEDEQWLTMLERTIAQSQQQQEEETEATLRYFLGDQQQYQTQYDRARYQFERSIKLFTQLGRTYERGRSLNHLASVRRRQRLFEEAEQLATEALALLGEDPIEQGYSAFVLGMIAFDRAEWVTATQSFEQALQRWNSTGQARWQAWGLNSLGNAYQAQGQYEAARHSYEEAIHLFEQVGDPLHLAVAKMNLGTVYLRSDDFSQALALYEEAQPTFQRTQTLFYLATLVTNQGIAHMEQDAWEMARQSYEWAITLWHQMGSIRALNAMDGLGLTWLRQGQPHEARRIFEEALGRLAQLPHDPGYPRLLAMLTQHLEMCGNDEG